METTMTMQIDLLLMPFGATYPDMRDAALAAEEGGFGGVWTWDHLRVDGGRGTVPECLTALAGIAEATSRVQLGTLVLNVNTRHPGIVANMAATLQEISGGRFVLGLGAGGSRDLPYAREMEALGMPVLDNPARRARVAEAAQVLRLLWSGERASFDGKHYRLDRAEGYMRPAVPPPIVIAGFGPRMAATAGRYGDGFNTPASMPDLEQLVAIAREERVRSGRDPQTFEISVFAGLSERWLSPANPARVRLEGLGVRRLILLTEPPYPVAQIRTALRDH